MGDMGRVFHQADSNMLKYKRFHHLMQPVKEQLFGELICSTPKTVAEFLTEAVTMEKVLQQHNWYDWQVNAASVIGLGSSTTDAEALRELIRLVVRGELHQLHQAQQPTTNYIVSIIRDQVQHALNAPRHRTPLQVTAPLQVNLDTRLMPML